MALPTPVPGDAPSADLIAALERNWRTCVRGFEGRPDVTIHDDGELFWFVTHLPDPAFNSVMHADLAPERVDAAVAELHALRARFGVEMNWLVGPSSRPADLAERLRARGLRPLADLTVLAARLDELAPAEAGPPGLRLEPVADGTSWEAWIAAERLGFEMEEPVAGGLAAIRRAAGAEHPSGMRHFLGRLDGEPVATSSVLLSAGVAGVFDVSVAPDARRRGVGRAMTLRAIDEARRAGYAWAFLQAAPMGEALYRRLGFRDCCVCRVYG